MHSIHHWLYVSHFMGVEAPRGPGSDHLWGWHEFFYDRGVTPYSLPPGGPGGANPMISLQLCDPTGYNYVIPGVLAGYNYVIPTTLQTTTM